MPKLEVNDKMVEDISLDELIEIQEGNLKTLKAVMGRFVKDDAGEYLPPEQGAAFVGKLNLKQLKALSSGLTKAIQDVAPNE